MKFIRYCCNAELCYVCVCVSVSVSVCVCVGGGGFVLNLNMLLKIKFNQQLLKTQWLLCVTTVMVCYDDMLFLILIDMGWGLVVGVWGFSVFKPQQAWEETV